MVEQQPSQNEKGTQQAKGPILQILDNIKSSFTL